MSAAIEFPIERLTDTALEISRRRRDTLVAVKQAIRNRDLNEADRLITELVPDDEKDVGIDPGIHRIAGRKR
jgi:hypothetical protein